jgi:hypothetical protein
VDLNPIPQTNTGTHIFYPPHSFQPQDEVAKLLRAKSGASESDLPLVKVLEGGTWTAGRKIAKEKRPETCGPPIVIVSDGTVF